MGNDISDLHEKHQGEVESPTNEDGDDERQTQDEKGESAPSVQGGEGDVTALTRDELYERARKLGIEGRSKMTKNELARAVRARG